MAVRNPADWTRYPNDRLYVPSRPILASEIDKSYADQVYALDAERMALSDCWYREKITSTAAFGAAGSVSAQLVRTWYLKAKDMCSVAGVVTADGVPWSVYVLAWITGGATMTLRGTTGASTNNQQSQTSLAATATWVHLPDINFRTNDTEESFILEGRVSTGAGSLYVAGLGLFAKET